MRRDGFMAFPRALAQKEMQTSSFTWVTNSIFYDNIITLKALMMNCYLSYQKIVSLKEDHYKKENNDFILQSPSFGFLLNGISTFMFI